MKRRSMGIWIIGWVLSFGILLPGTVFADDGKKEAWVSKVVSLQGRVLAKRLGGADWQPVNLDDTFVAGDQIQVGANSRAGIVLKNDAVLRLDQNTTLVFIEIEKERTFVLKLLEGAANFFSRRPRSLKILTPFVNGVVEGTEFFVQVDDEQTRIDLFEGRILAENTYGSLQLAKGQGATAMAGGAPQHRTLVQPRDSVQWAMYYPFVIDPDLVRGVAGLEASLALFEKSDTSGAIEVLKGIAPRERGPQFFIVRAGLSLHAGRVSEAESDLQKGLSLDPNNGDALALQAVIGVVQNRTKEALDLARRAVQRSPRSASASIALSYALQSEFKLQEALQASQDAVEASPSHAFAWARLAELQLSVGELDRGEQSAQKALQLNPYTAHARTTLGFAYLIQIKIEKAHEAFVQAIRLDSAASLPRLGLGLAKIRGGDLKQGRSEIEISVGLDPGNALMRSYLGKAYFDEKRGPLDEKQFEIAKALDPNDPTPWFYDAIRKQTLNRPVEALKDLQKSIELNDNRAIYRSKLQLDQDLASRSASLGRIYNDLGFQELAFRQGWRSLNMEPSNYSAHRLLADTYSKRPAQEIGRVSELLQSQLLQPINITAVQPQLAETDLLISEGSGAGSASFFELNPLFTRNRLAFQASGVAGDNQTWGDEISISGLYNQVSCSAGQYHYESEGFRENNHVDQDIYNVGIQAALTPKFNIQGEYRQRKEENGDLTFNWDLENFDPSFKRTAETETLRFGVHIKPAAHSDIIASVIHQDEELDRFRIYSGEIFGIPFETPFEIKLDSDGYIGEIQYIYDNPGFDILFGGGHYDLDQTTTLQDRILESNTKHNNGYFYSYFRLPYRLMWTIGASYDDLDDGLIGDVEQFNPKIGLNLSIQDQTMLRLASFRVLKRTLLADQTIEPTHVAGFNQFYDDSNGTDAMFYGAGLDHTFSDNIHAGLEYGMRRLEKRVVSDEPNEIVEDWDEDTVRLYFYWALSSKLALSTDYTYEKFNRDGDPRDPAPLKTKTHIAPIKLGYFHESGFFSRFRASYVNQEVTFADQPDETEEDDFTIFDAAVGYRFPKRYGVLSFEIRNLFDKSFNYMSNDARTSQSVYYSPFLPERTFMARVTISF